MTGQVAAEPARVDPGRVRATLGVPELAWLVGRLSTWIGKGRPLAGRVTLSGATPAEHQAVARLLGRSAGTGSSVSVPLADLEAELREAGVAPDLRTAVEVLTGPLADLAGARADVAARRAAMVEALSRGHHAGQGWYDSWCALLATDGTLTRLLGRREDRLAGQAAAVLGRLPADGVPVPVLAERVTGDTKALSGTPLAHLVLRGLAHRAGRPAPTRGEDRRALWEDAGVVLDDLASQVLVLGVTGREDHVVAGWLRDAAMFGIPFRLTLHMLTLDPLTPTGSVLYVCENPAVLRLAADELGDRCAPLICSEGVASTACHRLVQAATARGVQVFWRGDLDWTGVRTTNAAVAAYGALPWRMDADTYTQALETGESERLRGAYTPSTWDGEALSRALRDQDRAVMEERLIPVLLGDLGAARR